MMHEPAFDRDWFSKPADSLLAMMQRKRLAPSDVARELPGGLVTLRGLLTGDVAIDEAVAGGLAATLGGTTTFWLRRQELYEASLGRVVDAVLASDGDAWLATVPVPTSAGPATHGRTADDRRRAAVERRLAFFDVNGAEAWSRRYGTLRCETRFRESAAFEVHPGATAMWLRQGELEAALVSTDTWDPNGLSAAIGEIVELSRIGQPARFLPRLRAMLARYGGNAGIPVRVIAQTIAIKAKPHTVIAVRDQRERLRAEAEMHRLAHHDALTGLANRHQFNEALAKRFASRRSEDATFALLILDLDRFKLVNDTLGYPAADRRDHAHL